MNLNDPFHSFPYVRCMNRGEVTFLKLSEERKERSIVQELVAVADPGGCFGCCSTPGYFQQQQKKREERKRRERGREKRGKKEK